MILILIAVIACVLVGILIEYDEGYGEFLGYFLNSLLGVIFGLLIGIAIAGILPMDTTYKHYSLKIEALQDNGSVSGSFFLGSGQVEGKMKYMFYYEENGFYRLMQVDYKLVRIKYSDNKPTVSVTENIPTKSWINYFAIDFDLFDKTYIIEVPKGTIKNNYNLDAQ